MPPRIFRCVLPPAVLAYYLLAAIGALAAAL